MTDPVASVATPADRGAQPGRGGRGSGRRKRAAAYGRKSRKDESAVEAQLDQCARRAETDGWVIPDAPGFRFADDNVSGRKLDRPGINALLTVIQSGRAPFERLYIREVDRLARADDPRFTQWFEYECKRHGVEVCYVKDETHVDYEDESQATQATATFLTRTVKVLTAKQELQLIGRRIREGTRRTLINGFLPGSHRPYATERWLADKKTRAYMQPYPEQGILRLAGHAVRLKWVPALLPYVRFIFTAVERGDALQVVARELDRQGAPPPAGRDSWTARDVRRIASERLYIGDLHYGAVTRRDEPAQEADPRLIETHDPILVRGFMPDPPILPAQFEAVQRRLAKNRDLHERQMASKPEYILSGILRCAACGTKLHGHTAPAGRRSEARRYYVHPRSRTAGQGDCVYAHRYLPAEPLETSADTVVRGLLRGDHLQRAAKRELTRLLGTVLTTSHTEEIATITKQITDAAAAAQQAAANAAAATSEEARDIHNGTVNTLANQLSDLRRRLASQQAREAQLRNAESVLPEAARRARVLRQVLDVASPEDRTRIWRAVIARVDVDHGSHHARVHVRVPPLFVAVETRESASAVEAVEAARAS